jgi:hypothetical protein
MFQRTLCVSPFGQRAFVPIRRTASTRNKIIAVVAHGDFRDGFYQSQLNNHHFKRMVCVMP